MRQIRKPDRRHLQNNSWNFKFISLLSNPPLAAIHINNARQIHELLTMNIGAPAAISCEAFISGSAAAAEAAT